MSKSSIGGTLSIISGILGIVITALMVLSIVLLMNAASHTLSSTEEESVRFVMDLYTIFSALALLPSILAIAGGISALMKKSWRWALAGAIAASISFYFTGIAAVVLVAMSRAEFPTDSKTGAADMPQPHIAA